MHVFNLNPAKTKDFWTVTVHDPEIIKTQNQNIETTPH